MLVSLPLSKAVMVDDHDEIQRLILQGADLNEHDPRDLGNTPLHVAAMVSSLEILELLLQQKNLDLNSQNRDGDTALMLSIKMKRPPPIPKRLIEAGCDVSLPNQTKQAPLHVVLSKEYQELLELVYGGGHVDVHQRDEMGWTPMHYAINRHNGQALELLLRLGADPNAKCNNDMTPIMYATVTTGRYSVMEKLLDSRCDVNTVSKQGYSLLMLALKKRNLYVPVIVGKGAQVDFVNPKGLHVLGCTLKHRDSTSFDLLWFKMNPRSLLGTTEPFLVSYVRLCKFPLADWWRCLWMLLESDVGDKLIKPCARLRAPNGYGFFTYLIQAFLTYELGTEKRVQLLEHFLSRNIEVDVRDLAFTVAKFGYRDEFMLMMYACDNYEALPNIHLPMFRHRLGLEEDMTFRSTCQALKSYFWRRCDLDAVKEALRFFSLPPLMKGELIDVVDMAGVEGEEREMIVKSIRETPQLPTLVELSRDQSRVFIKRSFAISKPYHFYRAVSKVGLPSIIEDLILLKTPLH